MVTTTRNLALVAAVMATPAVAVIDMVVRYTSNMIDVGNLDAFTATWSVVYATDGSLQGVVTDDSYQTDTNACQTDDKEDLTVQVTMDGSWGAQEGVTQSDMRAAMVSTMWNSLIAIWEENERTVYEGCEGTTWQDGVLYTSDAACGPKSAVSCEDACADVGTPALVQCGTATSASKLPSTLKVTTYEDGTLLANELTVTFAATSNDVSDDGCGIVGVISEKLASFIPVVGGLFAEGIAFKCGDA